MEVSDVLHSGTGSTNCSSGCDGQQHRLPHVAARVPCLIVALVAPTHTRALLFPGAPLMRAHRHHLECNQ
jgi:hypothetical protein